MADRVGADRPYHCRRISRVLPFGRNNSRYLCVSMVLSCRRLELSLSLTRFDGGFSRFDGGFVMKRLSACFFGWSRLDLGRRRWRPIMGTPSTKRRRRHRPPLAGPAATSMAASATACGIRAPTVAPALSLAHRRTTMAAKAGSAGLAAAATISRLALDVIGAFADYDFMNIHGTFVDPFSRPGRQRKRDRRLGRWRPARLFGHAVGADVFRRRLYPGSLRSVES